MLRGGAFCWVLTLSVWLKSSSVTIQMKATKRYFPVMLFIMLYKVALTLSLWMKSFSVTVQMKAIVLYCGMFGYGSSAT